MLKQWEIPSHSFETKCKPYSPQHWTRSQWSSSSHRWHTSVCTISLVQIQLGLEHIQMNTITSWDWLRKVAHFVQRRYQFVGSLWPWWKLDPHCSIVVMKHLRSLCLTTGISSCSQLWFDHLAISMVPQILSLDCESCLDLDISNLIGQVFSNRIASNCKFIQVVKHQPLRKQTSGVTLPNCRIEP